MAYFTCKTFVDQYMLLSTYKCNFIIETNQRICNKMDHLIHFKTLLSTTDLFCTFGISKLIAVLFFVIIFFGQNCVINLANEFKNLDSQKSLLL